jgi:hypothetical protein
MMNGIGPPLILIGEPRTQAVDVRATALEREIAEHVVEGAVLEHQDDDMVDLLEVGLSLPAPVG